MGKALYILPFAATLFLGACSSEPETQNSGSDEKEVVAQKEKQQLFTFDKKELAADESGNFDVSLSLAEGYEIKKIEDAEMQDWGDGEVDITGTIDKKESEKELKMIISNGEKTERTSIAIDNNKAYASYEDYIKEKKDAKSSMKEARQNSKTITYKHLEKSLDGYMDEPYYLEKAYIVQAVESSGNTLLLVSINKNGVYYEDVIAVWMKETTAAVEGDFVEVYGKITEHYNYTLKAGGTNNVPAIMATKVSVVK